MWFPNRLIHAPNDTNSITIIALLISERLLNALRAQEDAEWQLKQLSARLQEDASEREQTRKTAEKLTKRISELEAQLVNEAQLREQLEDARKRMELKNGELGTVSLFRWSLFFCFLLILFPNGAS